MKQDKLDVRTAHNKLIPRQGQFARLLNLAEAASKRLGWGVALVAFLAFAGQTFAAQWYVRPISAGSATGTDWNNAWDMAGLNSHWSSVSGGDTVWMAGGTYTTGMAPNKSGTAGNPIYVKRVLAGDAIPAAAAGWSAAFDAQVIVSSGSPLRTPVSYLYIDGRKDMGMRFAVANSGGLPCSIDVTSGAFVTLTNLDLAGPSAVGHEDGSSCGSALATFNGDCSGLMVGYGYSPNPGAHDITLTHCRVRGHADEFWFSNPSNFIIENCKIYDNGAANSSTWHGNLMIVNGSTGITFRNNEVFNWQVEGLYPWGSVSRNWWVYGNVFHDGIGGKSGGVSRFLELRSYSGTITHGPFYVYNNTIVNCWAAMTQGDSTVFWSADSVAQNNLVWNVGSGIGYAPPTSDHNFSDGGAGGGIGSISSGVQPFVNYAGGDFRISSTVAANLPRNKGVAVGAAYNTDKDGNTRGADGLWDIGAYEYNAGGPNTNPVVSVSPSSLNFGSVLVGASNQLTLTVQNVGGGTLAGTATVSGLFTIVSGGTYSLGSNQSQTVTIRYSPTVAGSASQTVTFTGGGGASVLVTGVGSAPPPSGANVFSFEAEAGVVSAPFVTTGTYISQASEVTIPSAGGSATYSFIITNGGSYVVQVLVNAPSSAANSLWLNIDAEPQDPTMIWDMPTTTGFQQQTAAWRGTGTYDNNEFVPKIFTLATGPHQLIIRGREANVQLDKVWIFKLPPVPQNLHIVLGP